MNTSPTAGAKSPINWWLKFYPPPVKAIRYLTGTFHTGLIKPALK